MEVQTPAVPAAGAPDPVDIAIAQAEARQRSRRLWLVGLFAVGMLVGYPLSIGPLAAVYESGFCPDAIRVLLEIYLIPVKWAYDHNDWVQAFYEWYLPFLGVR